MKDIHRRLNVTLDAHSSQQRLAGLISEKFYALFSRREKFLDLYLNDLKIPQSKNKCNADIVTFLKELPRGKQWALQSMKVP